MGYSVGRVAKLAGVTVRTLHHYDALGLLSPGGRSAAGYRLYGEEDLKRLQRILYYRELGFTLKEIATILDDPKTPEMVHLERQRRLLQGRMERLSAMVAAIDREMEAREMDIRLTPEERLEVFGDFRPEEYEEEARRRWGETEAYRQSQRRVSGYTKDDWLEIKAEQERVNSALSALLVSGIPPGSGEAMDAAEEHRLHISRRFYDCNHELHQGLTQMYVSDERFRDYYEAFSPGLAEFIRDAARANAARVDSC